MFESVFSVVRFWPNCAGGVALIRPAASLLEAASRLISGKLSATDPRRAVAHVPANLFLYITT